MTVTVCDDRDAVERDLRERRICCPGCAAGLAPWGHARARLVRGVAWAEAELAAEEEWEAFRPRRGRCQVCGGTQVLLPVSLLPRRADTAEVIVSAVEARAAGARPRDIADGGPPLPWTVTTLGSLGTGGTPMVTKYQKFGDGYKAEAVKLYRESNQTIAETARNLGLKESTLANWVKKDKDNEAVAVGEAPLTPAERTRIRELEADVRRLNMENAFLKKASAYFASQNL